MCHSLFSACAAAHISPRQSLRTYTALHQWRAQYARLISLSPAHGGDTHEGAALTRTGGLVLSMHCGLQARGCRIRISGRAAIIA